MSPGDRTDEQNGKNWFYSDRIRSESVTRMGPSINYVRTKGEGGGSSLLYISIAYYMQKGGRGSK